MIKPNRLNKITFLSVSFCLLFLYAIEQSVHAQIQNPQSKLYDLARIHENVSADDPIFELFDSNAFNEDLAMQWVGRYTVAAMVDRSRETILPDFHALNINYSNPKTIDIFYESYYTPSGRATDMTGEWVVIIVRPY